mmetsp:Transcript_34794/g.95984  ORF Transcript_34794/g.95984 Transcript_34794/m.95984 type:complete len:211 (-) Transcript_34794:56-688(-)
MALLASLTEFELQRRCPWSPVHTLRKLHRLCRKGTAVVADCRDIGAKRRRGVQHAHRGALASCACKIQSVIRLRGLRFVAAPLELPQHALPFLLRHVALAVFEHSAPHVFCEIVHKLRHDLMLAPRPPRGKIRLESTQFLGGTFFCGQRLNVRAFCVVRTRWAPRIGIVSQLARHTFAAEEPKGQDMKRPQRAPAALRPQQVERLSCWHR